MKKLLFIFLICSIQSFGQNFFWSHQSCYLPNFLAASCGNATGSSIDATATLSSNNSCFVTSRGFQYSTDPTFNTILGSVTSSGSGNGQYTTTISGLDCSTQYYFRPWATNARGTYYATELVGTGCSTLSCALNYPIIRDYLDVDFSSTTTPSIVTPSNANLGGIMLLYIALNSNATISTPAGYTLIYKTESSLTYGSMALLYKIIDSGDIGASTTISLGSSSSGTIGKVVIVGRTSSPYFSTTSSNNYYANSSTTSLTTSTSGGLSSSVIFELSLVQFSTSTASVSFDSGFSYLGGVNFGNQTWINASWASQSTSGTMKSYSISSNISGKYQTFQLQILGF